MKKATRVFLFLLTICFLSACSGKEIKETQASPISLYDVQTEKSIALNMYKDDIEAIVGEPSLKDNEENLESELTEYYYPESNVYVTYNQSEVAVMLYVAGNNQFATNKGVRPSSKEHDFYTMYNVPKEEQSENPVEDRSSFLFKIYEKNGEYSIELCPSPRKYEVETAPNLYYLRFGLNTEWGREIYSIAIEDSQSYYDRTHNT